MSIENERSKKKWPHKKVKLEDTAVLSTANDHGGGDSKKRHQETKASTKTTAADTTDHAKKKRKTVSVPLQDENGVPYTKQQVRRMRKRVARGLEPIESLQEKQQRLREESKIRKEQEAILAGEEDEREDETQSDIEANDEKENDRTTTKADQQNVKNDDDEEEKSTLALEKSNQVKFRKDRKPVPDDYTCNACNNSVQPAHWIIECPLKDSRAKKARENKGHHLPDAKKVFVSGLPFTYEEGDVAKLLVDYGKVVKCNFLRQNGKGKKTGQALLTMASDEVAQKVIDKKQMQVQGKDKMCNVSFAKVLSRLEMKKNNKQQQRKPARKKV